MLDSNKKSIPLLCYLMCVFMALSIDIYLPSLPSIATTFKATTEQAQLTLNIFLIGFGFSQVLYGAISDHFGRRSSLLVGLIIYFISSLGCMFSTSIEILMFFRLTQSVGACSTSVSAYALARDAYDGKALLRILANIAIVMTVVPALAPLAGGIIDRTIGWRYSFTLLSIMSLFTIYFAQKFLEKDLKDNSSKLTLKKLILTYYDLTMDTTYIFYTLISAGIFVALYFFIASSPFLLIDNMKLSPIQYGMIMALNAIAIIFGNQLAKSIDGKVSHKSSIITGTLIMIFSSILMITFSTNHPALFILFMFLCSSGIGLVSSPSMAEALKHQSKRAGQASALGGFIRFSLAMIITTIFSPGFQMTAWIIIACSLLNLIFISLTKLPQKNGLTYEN